MTSRNPEFAELLRKMAETHEKKSHDYAQDNNVFSNFEYAARVSEPFKDPVDRVFATLIGVKLARLSELLCTGKTVNNESIEDTFLDGANYFAIWGSMYMKRNSLRKLNLNECHCDHVDQAHTSLVNGGLAQCKLCPCNEYRAKYTHEGNLIR